MTSIRFIVLILVSLLATQGLSFAQQAAPAPAAPAAPAPTPAPAAPPPVAPATTAQPPAPPPKPTGLVAEQGAILTNLTSRVDALDKTVVDNPDDDAKLVEARIELENIQSDILKSGVAFRPRLGEINASLEDLGQPPKEGEPAEPEENTARRQALTKEKQQINGVLGTAEDLQIRVNGLINKISNLRRDLFGNLLMKRYNLDAAIGPQVTTEVGHEVSSFWRNIASWFRFVVRFKSEAALAATFFALLAGVVFHFAGRRLLGKFLSKDPESKPGYLQRLTAAFWSTILPTLGLGIFMTLSFWLYDYYRVLTGDIGDYLGGLLGVLFITFFVNRLAYAALSPNAPNWRLIQIESMPARWLTALATLAAFVVGFDGFMGRISDSLGSPLSVTIVKSLLAALIVGLLMVVVGRIRPFAGGDGSAAPWPRWFRLSLYGLGALTILAALGGYISLAQFVSRQVVVTGAWVATAYIGLLASRAISDEGGFGNTAAGRWMKESYQTEDTRLDQLGVLTSVVINVLIVLTFLPYVLFQWGFQPGDIVVWMKRLATGFQIGTFTFSPLAIVTGLIVFLLGYLVTRWFQSWLDGTVMARGRVDVGVRNSIRAITGYTGMALAGLIAVSAAGLNLSNLALIAGGLSLGIGFGLQNVVSNFVSGLILLVERPFKAGDWVVAGDVSGTVKKVSVRATEIETFQRQTVILPNSLLINGAVGNWTHRNRMGRVDIPIGVIHGSDAEHVHQVLLEIARNHPLVLKNPEPFVLFAGFSETAMNFEVRVFLADISGSSTVQNDIRFAILRAFAKEGIVIAHTPRAAEAEPVSEEWSKDNDHAEAKLIDRLMKRADEMSDQTKKPRRSRPDPS